MNEQQHTATPSAAPSRRKLLRGALAVPAVLTVCSGGALASASHERCLMNAMQAPVTGPVTNAAGVDSLVRIQLWQRTSNLQHFISGDDLGSDVAVGVQVARKGEWQGFDVSNNVLLQDSGNPTSTRPNQLERVNRWVAVRYDADGRIVGIGKTGGGSAIGQSCWTSFAMGAG